MAAQLSLMNAFRPTAEIADRAGDELLSGSGLASIRTVESVVRRLSRDAASAGWPGFCPTMRHSDASLARCSAC